MAELRQALQAVAAVRRAKANVPHGEEVAGEAHACGLAAGLTRALEQFLESARATEQQLSRNPVADFESFLATGAAFRAAVGQLRGLGGDGSSDASIVRKLLLGEVARSGASIDWSAGLMLRLAPICPDLSDFLQFIPPSWTAADVSNLFYGRPDWAVFCSMSFCLWRDAVDTWRGTERELCQLVCSDAFSAAIHNYADVHGVSPSPAVAVGFGPEPLRGASV